MSEVRSPTVRRRELGTLLRALRNDRGMTVDQVAEHLLCSPSKVSRMETGQRGATARDIRDLCDLYGVAGKSERDHLMELAREGKRQGWWQPHELDFATYVGLEEATTAIKCFSCTIVMGLLQTPEYARAMHERGIDEFDPGRIDELVEVRLQRQQILRREPWSLHWVMDESVLRRVVGGPGVMATQLQRLLELAKSPNVKIQVIPYTTGSHPAMDSNFTVLEFDGSTSDVVYVEGLVGWLYLERGSDLDRYGKVFDRLSDLALSPQESSEMIADIATAYSEASVSVCESGGA
ncbi:MAG TPA: helix-turn-helix transcriptional regulator [Trebonia sp.]